MKVIHPEASQDQKLDFNQVLNRIKKIVDQKEEKVNVVIIIAEQCDDNRIKSSGFLQGERAIIASAISEVVKDVL